jgi:acyl-CoA dehydrogenase family protein 9
VENVVGEAGRGFKVAMEVLNSGRLGLASAAWAAADAAQAGHRARAGARPSAEHRRFRHDQGKDRDDARAGLRARVDDVPHVGPHRRGQDADYSLESAICKVFGSETLWYVVNETLQIAAGIGYMQEYPYERMLRDARINLIFEGTNEILRAFIALSGIEGPEGFAALAERRMEQRLSHMEDDSDEMLKHIARTAYAETKYPFDIL